MLVGYLDNIGWHFHTLSFSTHAKFCSYMTMHMYIAQEQTIEAHDQ